MYFVYLFIYLFIHLFIYLFSNKWEYFAKRHNCGTAQELNLEKKRDSRQKKSNLQMLEIWKSFNMEISVNKGEWTHLAHPVTI